MKNAILLSVYLLCLGGLSSCSTLNTQETTNQNDVFIEEVDANAIENSAVCSANMGSCNNSALVNYSKTEADFREYGERTKRDHLYTQSGIGNNLTASIPPSTENDIVVSNSVEENTPTEDLTQSTLPIEEDDFSKTASFILETTPNEEASMDKENLELATNITADGNVKKTVTVVEEIIEEKQEQKEIQLANNDSEFTVICEDDCEDLFLNGDNNISSEFTEESFDIEEFTDGDDEDINIETENPKETVIAELETKIEEVKITDDTVLIWEAKEGENLRELIAKWSNMSGWKLLWNTNRNYVLSAGVTFKGKFADVSSALIRAFARARPAPIATYYKGNRVIVVETMENENAY